MKVYILYDCCSSENIGYFTSRENAQKYLEDEIKSEKKWLDERGYSYDETSRRADTIIYEEPLDQEYKEKT